MDALTVRRYKGFRMPNSLEMNRTEKPAAASAAQSVNKTADAKAPENLRQLMDQVSRLESQLRQNYRTLQTGEAVLDEVQDSLERMAKLAKQALDGGDPAALQKELEQLRDEIGRMLDSASANGEKLFLNDGTEDAAALQEAEDAVVDSAQEQALPDWLVRGVLLGSLTSGQILSALGLDKTAAGADILDAVSNSSLEDNPALAYTAALYLGAVISGDPENCSQTDALHGLQQLFEQVAEGVPVDEAIAELTNGAFTSMEDFETQFLDGTAPGLGNFLTSLLLDDANSLLLDGLDFSAVDFSALALLGDLNGIDLSMLVMPSLFDMLQGAGHPAEQQDLTPETQNVVSEAQSAVSDVAADAANASGTAGGAAAASGRNAPLETAAVQYGTVLVTGRNLSGVSFDAARNVLTVSGTADVTVRGTDRNGPAIVLNGSGTVTLREVNIPALTVGHAAARAAGVGRIVLEEIRFLPGASLTLSGGRLEIGSLHRTGGSNTLYLTGGAVVTQKQADGTLQTLNIPVVLDGAVSFAAHAASVTAPEGKALDPLDIVWKTFLPGWDSISTMMVDGKQAKMELNEQDPLRLWLNRGDSGAPVHTVTLKGRSKSGEARTRYAYLRWNRRANAFQEVAMYPNPFRVTGGEEHRDWMYEQTSRTLRILTEKVTAVSGGTGTDANEEPFSGRIALTDNIGAPSLSLGGVVCRVDNGRAFSLGRGNDVTLILKSGFDNHFESGAGYAGISLLDGASLHIDCAAPHSSRDPAGTLTASGGSGGAGIGRDGRGSRDRTSSIEIRGGVITASGNGGGAGIGAGRRSAMGSIVISGGTITASGGKGGGAGIGGALHAPVGDISIRGGVITATAAEHAAAIGAGVQGESGNIEITGHARIKKAAGGDPGADIGACLFGGCGDVRIDSSANTGCARLRRSSGVPLRLGDDTVTLPQFRLSVPSLKLDRLSVLTREYAQHAISTIDTDRRWVSQIQDVYSSLYTQVEQNHLLNSRQYVKVADGRLRDLAAAGKLLRNVSQSLPQQSAPVYTRQSTKDLQRLFQ